jgi:hypothetical protein
MGKTMKRKPSVALTKPKLAGKNKMRVGKRSAAELVVWALKSGPRRKTDLEAGAIERIAMGADLRGEVHERMALAGLLPTDAAVYVAANDSDFARLGEYAEVTADGRASMGWKELLTLGRYADEKKKWKIFGLIVCIYDRDKDEWLGFTRPFVVSDPRALRHLEYDLDEIRLKKTKESLTGAPSGETK